MQKQSFWNICKKAEYPPLRGRNRADVVVAGGGLSGLTCALWLSRIGLKVSLLEADTLGSGISGSGAGIVSLTNGLLYSRLEKHRDIRTAQRTAVTLKSAMRSAESFAMDAGVFWRKMPLFLTASEKLLESEARAIERAGITARLLGAAQGGVTQACLKLEETAVVDVGGYLSALIRACEESGVNLYERSRVIASEIQEVRTAQGTVYAPYIIIATGYPIVNVPGWYFMKLEQRENLLFWTNQEMQERIELDAENGSAVRPLSQGALIFQNDSSESALHKWGGEKKGSVHRSLECYTPDGLPYIGPYGRKTPNLFVACGYGGMGILGSMMAAQAISARILALPAEDYEIYSGQRSLMRMNTPLKIAARYAWETVKHPSAPRCPHMGCRLIHNPQTRLWECPCHGSRFDDIGHVLNAPAVNNAILENRKS